MLRCLTVDREIHHHWEMICTRHGAIVDDKRKNANRQLALLNVGKHDVVNALLRARRAGVISARGQGESRLLVERGIGMMSSRL